MNCSTPGFPVHHYLPDFAQTHVHWVSDAIQPSHPLLSHFLPPSGFPSIRVFSNESVLQGIFPTQGWNPGVLHCRWILYQLSHQGSQVEFKRTSLIPPRWPQLIPRGSTAQMVPWLTLPYQPGHASLSRVTFQQRGWPGQRPTPPPLKVWYYAVLELSASQQLYL